MQGGPSRLYDAIRTNDLTRLQAMVHSAADAKTNPALFAAPHAMCVDSRGDFYVVEPKPRRDRPGVSEHGRDQPRDRRVGA